jgi:DNA invertase Pin-like site-specific DNA recombinase
MRIGYQRVSTQEQNVEGQTTRLREAGCDRIFTDHGVSGTKASRPELDKMIDMLRPGDVVTIVRLDRLGRSVKNLVELVEKFSQMGVDLHVIEQGIDTRTPAGKLVFHIFAALAEFERDVIRARTLDGLAAARERGNCGGRSKTYTDNHVQAIMALRAAGTLSMSEIAATVGLSRATAYRAIADNDRQPART